MRLTFGLTAFEGGFNNLPVILGMFAVSQVVADALDTEGQASAVRATMSGVFVSVRDYIVHGWNMLRSSLIGIWIGILPGVGATVASIVAYTTAKNLSREAGRVRYRQRGGHRRARAQTMQQPAAR